MRIKETHANVDMCFSDGIDAFVLGRAGRERRMLDAVDLSPTLTKRGAFSTSLRSTLGMCASQ